MLLRLGLLVALSGDGCSAPPVEPPAIVAQDQGLLSPAPLFAFEPPQVQVEVRLALDPVDFPELQAVLAELRISEKYRSFRESLSAP